MFSLRLLICWLALAVVQGSSTCKVANDDVSLIQRGLSVNVRHGRAIVHAIDGREDAADALPLRSNGSSNLGKPRLDTMKGQEEDPRTLSGEREPWKAKRHGQFLGLSWDGPPFFFEVASLNAYQLVACTSLVGQGVWAASRMICGGAESLHFFPAVGDTAGSMLEPILGAIPNALMMFFTGFGGLPGHSQIRLPAGLGVLAGSSVMLLTFAWFLVIMCGSVPLDADGTPNYKRVNEASGLFARGISLDSSIYCSARMLVLTSLCFLIVEIPAFFVDGPGVPLEAQARALNPFALLGFVIAGLFLIVYIFTCLAKGNKDSRLRVIIEGIITKELSLATVMAHSTDEEVKKNLPEILRWFFHHYDSNQSGYLEVNEFAFVMRDLGEEFDREQVEQIFELHVSTDRKDKLSFDEFCAYVEKYTKSQSMEKLKRLPAGNSRRIPAYGIEGTEEEGMEKGGNYEPIEEQGNRMVIKSVILIVFGIFVAFCFAAPTVNLCMAWGAHLGIPGHFVAFVIAPLLSNSGQLWKAWSISLRKSSKSATQAIETLIGTACMNNTLCLAILLVFMYTDQLAWTSIPRAEVFGMLIVQWTVALLIGISTTQRILTGFFVLSLYPLCLFITHMS